MGTLIAFRLGVADAKIMAEEMGSPVDPEDFENLKNFHAIVKTVIQGEVFPLFTFETELARKREDQEATSLVARITSESRAKYGRSRLEVEKEIRSRSQKVL